MLGKTCICLIFCIKMANLTTRRTGAVKTSKSLACLRWIMLGWELFYYNRYVCSIGQVRMLALKEVRPCIYYLKNF